MIHRYLTLVVCTSLLFNVACSSSSGSKPGAGAATPAGVASAKADCSAAKPSADAEASLLPPAGAATRVTASVQSIGPEGVSLSDGTIFTLAPNARVVRQELVCMSDLKVGMYVAITGKRQADNTVVASIVSVFPASVAANVPSGQSPRPGGNLMTNATISEISGRTFTVTFDGGGAKISAAPDAQLIKQTDASAGDLKAGLLVTVTVNNGVAQNVLIQ
jgi:hypothetical protein